MKKINSFKSGFCLALLCAVSSAYANPQTPTVIAGDVTFDQPDQQTLNVNSTSDRSIVNWGEFSINSGETTFFNLPSSSSAILNRVTSSSVSNILGAIQSNGQVFLINPNSVIFGPDAVINTSAFLASSLDADDMEFLNVSDMTFTGTANSDAYVINYGTITATDGDAVLLSYQVINAGSMYAENGTVAEGAGIEIILQPSDGDNRILIIPHTAFITAPLGIEDGGYINALHTELQADGNAYQLAIKHDGWIDARGLPGVGSTVKFAAYEGNTFENGTITSADNGDVGGFIAVTGHEVELGDSSVIYASGQNGGGTVYVGGGWGGQDPNFINAENTVANGSIECDAILSGEGGTVVVWADDTTDFFGTILARGGQVEGNGGLVEVSGVQTLNFSGTVDVHAFNGEDGLLVLDPENLNYNPREASGLFPATPVIISP